MAGGQEASTGTIAGLEDNNSITKRGGQNLCDDSSIKRGMWPPEEWALRGHEGGLVGMGQVPVSVSMGV